MPFCPNCHYEYLSGKKVCPDCGAKLVEKLEKPKPVEKIIEEEESELALLYTTRSIIYANFLKDGLEKAGISCLVKSEAGLFPRGIGAIISHPLTDIKIYIPKKALKEGEEIKKMLVNNLD